MQTTKWGPGLWNAIHCMTFNYPLQPDQVSKDNFKNYLDSLKLMLPCAFCRESFTTYLKYFPIEKFWDSRYGITYMLFYIHNLVNAKLNKPLIDFKECVYTYERMRARCSAVIDNPEKYAECIKQCDKFTDEQILEFNKFTCQAIKEYNHIAKSCEKSLNLDPNSPNNQVKVCKFKIFCDYF